MATENRRLNGIICVFALWTARFSAYGELPDFGVFRDVTGDLQVDLHKNLNLATAFDDLQEDYEEEAANLDLKALNGEELLQTVSTGLGQLMSSKLAALKESVDWAEKIAQNYTWNPTLAYGDVDYVSVKNVNLSDPAYEESDTFRQLVNFENSSVHIPVEIYEGEINILNGLAWTDGLDEQWKRNREKDPKLLWQYFGSQTGLMRNYPASIWAGSEPDLYDVRRRPWYTQGASSPKDMLILIDTSGSTQGQALMLMKQAVNSLVETLGENDFVFLANFASETTDVVSCFSTFVQATYWNKVVLREYIDRLEANNMANYHQAFEYAFEKFRQFNVSENRTEGTGAMCNKMIMFLTDGGTETPEDVFAKYNSDQRVRIFTYAVGPTANPVEAVRWIACANRGYFDRIPAMGAIRSKVQNYYRFLSGCLAESQDQNYTWTRTYADSVGLGMMTSVTLPVYNRTLDASNQTILGVMGCDVTVSDMEKMIPVRQIGTNGYMMAINANGYIVFHPDLKAKLGYVADPANVDFMDIEYSAPGKEEVRRAMIDQEEGQDTIMSYVYLPDGKYIDNRTRIYQYIPIPNSTFSLGLVLPEYTHVYSNGRKVDIDMAEGIRALEPSEETKVVVSSIDYCGNITGNGTDVENLISALQTSPENCDMALIQSLFSDAKLTLEFVKKWKSLNSWSDVGFRAFFVSTNAGLTRITPANASHYIDVERDPWNAVYYKRAFDSDHWLYSAQPVNYDKILEENETMPATPLVMVSRAMTVDISVDGQQSIYKPGVIGAWMTQEKLRQEYMFVLTECKEHNQYSCYFLDDGGYIILGNDPSEDDQVGTFFGAHGVESSLMGKLIEEEIYIQNVQYDYQAACSDYQDVKVGAGTRIYIPTIFYDILSVSWWTSKFTWSILNMSFLNWLLYPSEETFVTAQVVADQSNISCVNELAQYTFNEGDTTEQKMSFRCSRNCSRKFASSRIKQSNLLFVIVDKDCGCDEEVILHKAHHVPDPNFANNNCNIPQRYRKRPPCYDFDPNEDTSDCSGSSRVRPSALAMVTLALLCSIGRKLTLTLHTS